jgi:hypothetical protein
VSAAKKMTGTSSVNAVMIRIIVTRSPAIPVERTGV